MRDFNIRKLYYSISEVSKITEVEQYVLRFWETEFEQLKPQKNRAGNRTYTNKDIELILFIKSLLREQKYTIEGAKQILADYVKSKLNGQSGVSSIEDKFVSQIEEPDLFDGLESSKDNSEPLNLERALLEVRTFLEQLLQKV